MEGAAIGRCLLATLRHAIVGSRPDRLEKEYDLQRVRLLVVDPISAYLGTAKSPNHGTDVRTVLGRFAMFAAQHDLGGLAISHLNKTSGARAITRIMGSLEWVAAPRAVFLVTEEAGTDRRLFLPLKNNLASDRFGYAFRIEDRVVAHGIKTSAVVWDQEPVVITADEALAAAAKGRTSGAIDFLEQVLSDGPVGQTEIVRLGKEAGYSEKNLRTAREKLGVTPQKEGFGPNGKWVWVPAGGATVLKLVVNNPANGPTAGSGENMVPNADHAEPGGPYPIRIIRRAVQRSHSTVMQRDRDLSAASKDAHPAKVPISVSTLAAMPQGRFPSHRH